jgi:hypothetical protein
MAVNHQQSYQELNAVLDIVQESFTSLVEREGLTQASIEKWRWDYPVITLTWAADGVNRNINVLAASSHEGEFPSRISEPVVEIVEVNAWRDLDEDETTRIRHWRHEVIMREAKAGRDYEQFDLLDRSIRLAYKVVSGFTENDFDQKTLLNTSNPAE